MNTDRSGAGYGNHGGDEGYGRQDLGGQDGAKGGDHEAGKPVDQPEPDVAPDTSPDTPGER